jgi:hypothetical protein
MNHLLHLNISYYYGSYSYVTQFEGETLNPVDGLASHNS